MKNKVKIKTIFRYLSFKFPLKKAEEWDKVGLAFGDVNRPISKAVIALDLTKEVFDLAIESKAGLIITHHPFYFEENIEDDFKKAPYKEEIHNRLKNTEIGLIVLHTNYDLIKMSEALSNRIGIKSKSVADVKYGKMYNKKTTIEDLELLLKTKTGLEIFQRNFNNNIDINNFAILPGSGSPEEIIKMHFAGANLIITSDIKWSTWIMANQMKINLVQISHAIEEVFVDDIWKICKKQFKNIKFIKALL